MRESEFSAPVPPSAGVTCSLGTAGPEKLRNLIVLGKNKVVSSMINYSAPDLTQHPPRSVRVRLGGYAHLSRLLDKARAVIAGKGGEYHYNCPLDQLFFAFTGIGHEAMLAEIKTGKTDVEILEWIGTQTKRLPYEIAAWSAWVELRGPGGEEGHEWIASVIKSHKSARDDIRSFADLLDFDDYLSYGGKA